MLTRITGQLERVEPVSNAGASGCASCVVGLDIGLAYEALLPSYTAAELIERTGERVTLHTVEVLEQGASGGNITPRVLGFASEDDRRFFDLLTKVKGLGAKRVLRLMAAPTAQIALAIEREDAKFLKSLPEVGPKLAETIARELKGKATPFVDARAREVEVKGAVGANAKTGSVNASMNGLSAEAQQAALALVRLGQSESDAQRMVRLALERDESLAGADEILAAAFGAR
jgi:Holliday junction DNA helicase RuvA